MDFSQVSLDLIGKLKTKNIAHQKKNQNPINFVPIGIIQSLLDRLNLIKAEIFLNAIESRTLLVRKIKGMAINLLEQELYQFDLTYIASSNPRKYQNIIIGKIIIYSHETIESNQLDALRIFTSVLGEHIGDQLFNASRRRSNNVYKQISNDINLAHGNTSILDNIDEEETLDFRAKHNKTFKKNDAGSLICYLIKHLYNSSKSFAVYFGIIYNGRIYIDYMQCRHDHNHDVFVKNKWYSFSNIFLKQIDKYEISLNPLNYVIENNDVKKDWQLLTLVIKHDDAPIGAFILQLDPAKVFFYNPIKKLLDYIRQLNFNEFRYLFQRRTKKLIVDPIFSSRETRVIDSKVFVLMPFSAKWSKRIWEKYIKPTIEKLGLVAERADDLYGKDIMEDIWKGILSAKIIIADITGRNPNVLYELGVVHAIGKDFIMITQNIKDIPFDLNRYRCIRYEDNADGYEKLERELLRQLASKMGDKSAQQPH